MKRFLTAALLVIFLLALLTGCNLPAIENGWLIPDTGQQAAQVYPPPGGATETPEPTSPYNDEEDPEFLATIEPPDAAPTVEPTLTFDIIVIPEVSTSPSPTLTDFPSPTPGEMQPVETASPTPSPSPSALVEHTPTPSPSPSALVEHTPTSSTAAPGLVRDSLLGREQFFTDLASSQVRNLTDGEIGTMSGVIYDSLSGEPLFAVVAPEWLLGIRRGSVAVPWGALNLAGMGIYQPQAGVLLLPVPSHVLSTGPTIDRRLWNRQSPPANWDTGITDYWVNFVPMIPQTSPPLAVRGEPLLVQTGMRSNLSIDVTDSEGEILGRVKDLVIDANGNARYAIVLVDDLFGVGGRLAPVPWNRLVWSSGGWFILRGSSGLLRAAPGYATRGAFPDFNQNDWDREIRGYWIE